MLERTIGGQTAKSNAKSPGNRRMGLREKCEGNFGLGGEGALRLASGGGGMYCGMKSTENFQ